MKEYMKYIINFQYSIPDFSSANYSKKNGHMFIAIIG